MQRTEAQLKDLPSSLDVLFNDLVDATTKNRAQVFILAYPNLLAGEGTCGRISATERKYGASVITDLNKTLRDAVKKVQVASGTSRLEFLDDPASAIDGRGPCSEQSWAKPYGLVSLFSAKNNPEKGQQILHPNEQGYASIGDALRPHLGKFNLDSTESFERK